MSLQVYARDETDFGHRGLGLPETYNAVVTWSMNAQFTLTFDYPLHGKNGSRIEKESIIKASTPEGDNLFRVQELILSMGVVSVTAYQVFWDLASNFIDDINLVGDTGIDAVQHIMSNTQYPHRFEYSGGLSNTANVRIVRMSVVNALIGTDDNTFITRYGGEFDWQGFQFNVVAQLGEDRGVVFRNKKNLTGYKQTTNYTGVVTRLMPEGYNGLFLPERYIDSPLITNYTTPKVGTITYSDIKAIETTTNDDGTTSTTSDEDTVPLNTALEMLRTAGYNEFSENHIDEPTVDIELNVVMLEDTEEYKDTAIFSRVYPGDTATFIHDDDGINVKARLTGYTWDPVVNEYLTQTYNSVSRSVDDIGSKLSQITNKVETVDSNVTTRAVNAATDVINSGFGGYVKVEKDRILVMDTDSKNTASDIWQWNKNGFGYSSTGINGPYRTAITMDGHINADFITTGTLNADIIKAGSITGDKLDINAIQVGFNSMGSTLKIDPWSLNFFNGNNQVLALDQAGLNIWQTGVNIGRIHGNVFINNPSIRGLNFDLNTTGDYMAWGVEDDTQTTYVVKLAWYNQTAADFLAIDPGFVFDDIVRFNSKVALNSFQTIAGKVINLGSYTIDGNPGVSLLSSGGHGIVLADNELYFVDGGGIHSASGFASSIDSAFSSINSVSSNVNSALSQYQATLNDSINSLQQQINNLQR